MATLRDISQILHIHVNHDWTHFIYLGIPIAKKTFASSMWAPVIQKIKNKIHSMGSKWLNLAGKVTLIHSILSSYPIYTSSMILAPKTVINSICMEIRNFFWQGGKVQNKKFHLVKWTTVKDPKHKGGLGIRDPDQMNKVLGAKLVWRLATGKKYWWKEVIRRKYIKRSRSKILNCSWDDKGTSLWLLCKASLNLIQSNYYLIPGNGKKIQIWEHIILGHPSLSMLPELGELSEWELDNGIISLFDLSSWN